MNCSLNCFCDFYQAPTTERKRKVVRRYKDGQSGQAKGRSSHYTPVLNAIKGKLCPHGTVDEKIAAIAKACVRLTSTDQLNQARIGSNLLVFHAFRSVFGNTVQKVFPCPRMQIVASPGVSVNIQPDLYFEANGKRAMVKLCVSKQKRPEPVARMILQMLYRGVVSRSIELPINQLFFVDVRAGNTFTEPSTNPRLDKDLEPIAQQLNEIWNEAPTESGGS